MGLLAARTSFSEAGNSQIKFFIHIPRDQKDSLPLTVGLSHPFTYCHIFRHKACLAAMRINPHLNLSISCHCQQAVTPH